MSQQTLEIVIAGGGTAGWMSAALLSRFLPGARIVLVESEAIGTVGVGEATIPQIHLFNQALGLDEAQFVRETRATFKLGIEFDGWFGAGQSYMHAFGVVGRAAGIIPFRHLWLRGRAEGVAGPLGDYIFNEVAAYHGRMAGAGTSRSGSGLVYAYHFDASLYAAFLRRYAEARGVERIEGKIGAVERDGATGNITGLKLDGNRAVSGTFFIDCTGFRSLLLGDALGEVFDDWSGLLPCDRALAVPCARSEAFRPYTQSTAREAGWQWRIPLQHRTGNGHVYCSDFLSDDEAAAILLANLDGEPLDDPRPLRFKAGRRKQAWSHNCVALGLAAGFLEPLESTSIHLIQSSLARLVKFLPASGDGPAARDAFNRMTTLEWEQVRDFIILHYWANRGEGAFWARCRDMTIPDKLAEKIALFEEGGAIVREDGELFTEEAWTQVLIGQGIQARSYSPLAASVPAGQLGEYLTTMAKGYQQMAQQLPSHAEYIATLAGRGASGAEFTA